MGRDVRKQGVRRFLLLLAVTATVLTLPAPVSAQSGGVGALAPARSPLPPARPATGGALASLTAGPAGIARITPPPPRPAAAQLPASMVPAAPPAAPRQGGAGSSAAVTDLPVFHAADLATALLPDDMPAAPVAPAVPVTDPPVEPMAVAGAVAAALADTRAASPPSPRPEAVAAAVAEARAAGIGAEFAMADPRAVASSLVPPQRTAAAQRRFRSAAAARASQPVTRAAAGGQAPTASQPSGPGLCGDPALQGRRLPRITSSTQGCGVAEPVSVTHIHGIQLSQPATLHCEAARATSRWVRDVMIPAVGRRGGGLAQIRVAGHYVCRTRNHQRGARISEHGRGRAIDISGYRLADGTRVSVLRDYPRGPHSAALRQMRAGACGIFRTTLGPGVRFHDDHFHFDVAQHRGGGTFCR